MALRIKDTSVIWTAIDGPKWSAIEMCTYLTSELRTSLYSVLWMHSPAPNGHVNELYNMVKGTPLSTIASASKSVPRGSS